MIHVMIDVLPHGNEAGRRTVHEVLIANTTGEVSKIASYAYQIKTVSNDGSFRDATGTLEGFERDRGHLALVTAVLNKIEGAE